MPHKVVHYLRNERIAAALTQADIAALLGVPWKSRVVRYERKGVVPPVQAALAYQAIYGKPVANLLRGTYNGIESEVRKRAREMLARGDTPRTPRQLRRQRSLERIAAIR
jgi:transcriptional regulator with XRE-family HTH domain